MHYLSAINLLQMETLLREQRARSSDSIHIPSSSVLVKTICAHLLSLLVVPKLTKNRGFSLRVSSCSLGHSHLLLWENRLWDQITAFLWKLGIGVNTSTKEYTITTLIWDILLIIFSCMSFTLFLSIAGGDGGMNHITAAGNFRNTAWECC